MQKCIAIITEAREMLVKHFVKFLRDTDEVSLAEFIREGNWNKIDIPKMSDSEVVEKVAELELLAQVKMIASGIDLVLVKTGEYTYKAIWSNEPCDPH